MRTTLAVLAVGLLGVSGCAPSRARTTDAFIASRVPAPACKPNAFVDGASATSSPYASHVVATKPIVSATVAPVEKPPPVSTPAVQSATAAPGEPSTPQEIAAEPTRPSEPPTPLAEPAPRTGPPSPLPEPVPTEHASTKAAPEPPAPLEPTKPAVTRPTPAPLPEPTEPAGMKPAPTELPAKLPERPVEPAPQRPSLPEGPSEVSDMGETPEPEPLPKFRTPVSTPTPPTPIKPVAAVEVPRRESSSTQALTGTVECWRKTYRLRYARVDVEDANGGRVTLIGPGVERLQDGQRVRARGTLIPAADRGTAPTFQVQTLEVLAR